MVSVISQGGGNRWREGDGARFEGVTASSYVSASHCDELTKPKASPADP